MTIATLTSFFMWCTIINSGLMAFWIFIHLMAPNAVFRMQQIFFPISRETWDIVFYSFLAVFKIFVIIFNLVPFIALLIIG